MAEEADAFCCTVSYMNVLYSVFDVYTKKIFWIQVQGGRCNTTTNTLSGTYECIAGSKYSGLSSLRLLGRSSRLNLSSILLGASATLISFGASYTFSCLTGETISIGTSSYKSPTTSCVMGNNSNKPPPGCAGQRSCTGVVNVANLLGNNPNNCAPATGTCSLLCILRLQIGKLKVAILLFDLVLLAILGIISLCTALLLTYCDLAQSYYKCRDIECIQYTVRRRSWASPPPTAPAETIWKYVIYMISLGVGWNKL